MLTWDWLKNIYACSEVREGFIFVLEVGLEGEEVLESFVGAPADGGRRGLEHHPSTQTLQHNYSY